MHPAFGFRLLLGLEFGFELHILRQVNVADRVATEGVIPHDLCRHEAVGLRTVAVKEVADLRVRDERALRGDEELLREVRLVEWSSTAFRVQTMWERLQYRDGNHEEEAEV